MASPPAALSPKSLSESNTLTLPTLSSSSVVHLNIGGHRFTTTRDTLLSVPDTLFHPLLSNRFPCARDEQGAIFVDRDGQVSACILSFWLLLLLMVVSLSLVCFLWPLVSFSAADATALSYVLVLLAHPYIPAYERSQSACRNVTAGRASRGQILSR